MDFIKKRRNKEKRNEVRIIVQLELSTEGHAHVVSLIDLHAACMLFWFTGNMWCETTSFHLNFPSWFFYLVSRCLKWRVTDQSIIHGCFNVSKTEVWRWPKSTKDLFLLVISPTHPPPPHLIIFQYLWVYKSRAHSEDKRDPFTHTNPAQRRWAW